MASRKEHFISTMVVKSIMPPVEYFFESLTIKSVYFLYIHKWFLYFMFYILDKVNMKFSLASLKTRPNSKKNVPKLHQISVPAFLCFHWSIYSRAHSQPIFGIPKNCENQKCSLKNTVSIFGSFKIISISWFYPFNLRAG